MARAALRTLLAAAGCISICALRPGKHGTGTPCSTTEGRQGRCVDKRQPGACEAGEFQPGLCPGDEFNVCCLSVSCGVGGTCLDTRVQSCDGGLVTGLCPGADHVQCCEPVEDLSDAHTGIHVEDAGVSDKEASLKEGVGEACETGNTEGQCIDTSRDRCDGTTAPGLCPGDSDVTCCLPTPVPIADKDCGAYSGATTMHIAGNRNAIYTVTKIRAEDLTTRSYADATPFKKDNTFTAETACAFARLKAAAKVAGVTITINSGFRTVARQQEFWDLYQAGKGNLAARPGRSNHGRGVALDLQLNSAAYAWMSANGAAHGFIRTVASEKWHWEYRPGNACNSVVSYSCS